MAAVRQEAPDGPASRSREGAARRRALVRQLLAGREIGTQEELRRLLLAQGIHVNQATLSRDLAQLGARHAARPGGGTVYDLAEPGVQDPLSALRELGHRVLSIDANPALLVIKTEPGSAPAVARALDLARLPESLGTLAGDDAVFLALRSPATARPLTRRLSQLFWKGAHR